MANQHFFKPLLPGFHSHLTIPKAFFLKNIKGRNKKKTVKLRSDAAKISWEVKIDEQRLTDGWKEFALAHDLRIGDFVVFRQENVMAFHVTIFGPSCCEIQYESCLDVERNLQKIQRNKNPKRDAESSSVDLSCFVAKLEPSTLRYDTLFLPKSFVRANDLDTRNGEIVLMNEKGISWNLALKQNKSCGTVYINRGWRCFCNDNGLKAGDIFTFKLIQREGTMVLSLSPRESKEECSEENEVECLSTEMDEESSQDELISHECSRRKDKKASSSPSPSENRLVTLTLKPYNITNSKLNLPLPFTRINYINKETQMSLLDKHGVKWSTKLRSEKKSKRIRLLGGWKDFFKANCVKIGESVILKLIWEEDRSCVLKFCSKVNPETI